MRAFSLRAFRLTFIVIAYFKLFYLFKKMDKKERYKGRFISKKNYKHMLRRSETSKNILNHLKFSISN